MRAFAFVPLVRALFICLCSPRFSVFFMIVSSFQIAEKLELLLTEREGLYATWEDHKTELDQAYDLHVFLRDAKQIDTLTSTQEVKLIARFRFLFLRGIGITRIKYRNGRVSYDVKNLWSFHLCRRPFNPVTLYVTRSLLTHSL